MLTWADNMEGMSPAFRHRFEQRTFLKCSFVVYMSIILALIIADSRASASSESLPCEWLHVYGSDRNQDVMGLYRLNASSYAQDVMEAVWNLASGDALLYASHGPANGSEWTEWVIASGPNVVVHGDHSSAPGVRLYVEDKRPTPSAGDGTWYDARNRSQVPTMKVACMALDGVHDDVQAQRELVSIGNNFYGQLRRREGIQSNNVQNTAERVGTFGQAKHTASSVSIGCNHGLAIAKDLVWAWGSNLRGELASDQGLGLAGANPDPYQVDLGGAKALAVAAGGFFSIALVETASGDTAVKSWGSNQHGMLGRQTSGAFDHDPADVAGIDSRVQAVRAGRNHAAALASDAGGILYVYTWGSNKEGQLGRRTSRLMDATPARLSPQSFGNKRIQDFALGRYHRCADTERDLPFLSWGG